MHAGLSVSLGRLEWIEETNLDAQVSTKSVYCSSEYVQTGDTVTILYPFCECLHASIVRTKHTHALAHTRWLLSTIWNSSRASYVHRHFATRSSPDDTLLVFISSTRCYKWWFSCSIKCRAFCWLYAQPSVKYHPLVELNTTLYQRNISTKNRMIWTKSRFPF